MIEHPAEAQERAERAHVRAREYAWSRGRETLLRALRAFAFESSCNYRIDAISFH